MRPCLLNLSDLVDRVRTKIIEQKRHIHIPDLAPAA